MSDRRQWQIQQMVERQLRGRGIRDERVLGAMAAVPRHRFVRAEDIDRAYDDAALPIEAGQTISQPYIVAWMTQALQLQSGQSVLEIGTGCGYQAAVLVEMGGRVTTVERHEDLAALARRRLADLGYAERAEVVVGDGTLGWPPYAPYDRIIVTAAAPYLPRPLEEQVRPGGRIVIPIGGRENQHLYTCDRLEDRIRDVRQIACRFVPLVGAEGWQG